MITRISRVVPFLTLLGLGFLSHSTPLCAVAGDIADQLFRERVSAMREEAMRLRNLADELRARGEYEEEKRVREKGSELKYGASELERTGGEDEDAEDDKPE